MARSRSIGLLLLGITLVFCASCGKRGAPIPPKEKVLQRVVLEGYQRGNQVILSWQMPEKNDPKSSVLNISRIDVYRLAGPADAAAALTEEDFANRSTIITAIPVTDADFGKKVLSYRDPLQFANQAARLHYALRLVNASGQKAAFSNTLLIEPSTKVASAPSALTVEPSQDAIRLKWQAPTANVDGSTPASIQGYNVYRSNSMKEPATLLNKTPVTAAGYDDEFFNFGKEYFYFVRAVSIGLQSEPVESTESNIVTIKPVDTFVPIAPTALTIAASPGTISVFFAINPEKDVVGYKVYRSTDETLPKERWTLLTPELLKANTFQDATVDAGKTYYYYVTATDAAGNVSPPSEVTHDTAVPKTETDQDSFRDPSAGRNAKL